MTYAPSPPSYGPPPPPGYGPPPPQQPPPGGSAPLYKRTWFIIVITAIVALIIGSAAGAGAKKTQAVPGATVTATSIVGVPVTATVTAQPRIIHATVVHTRTVTVTAKPAPPQQRQKFGDGIYVVGTDIAPGIYHTAGSTYCGWARLSSLNTNDYIDGSVSPGPMTIQVEPTDVAVRIIGGVGGCTFTRIG